MNETPATAQQDFDAFFAAQIAPALPALEAVRKDRLRSATLRALATAFVVVLAALVAWLLGRPWVAGGILVVGLAAGYFLASRPVEHHRKAVRDLFIPPLCRFLQSAGETVEYHRRPGDRFDLDGFKRSGVLLGFGRSKVVLEDFIGGRHRDTDYRMVEARLKQSGKSSTTTVFAGLLCDISVPQPFSCKVVISPDTGGLGNKVMDFLRGGFAKVEQVPLGHAAFEQRFRVYSDNPEEARGLLQEGLLDSLLAIADGLGKQAVSCAFFEGRFLVIIPQSRNLFEVGRLHRSLAHAEEDLRRLAGEFTIPQRLIDNLHGERSRVLPES
ncbi:DUF3137 domain-containing protein [Pelagibius marinus]|uniref:DUF3137 domain-containing protein n=1 Tax=Pelagibius marinus TaxID=2762760 RepID=UPI001872BBE8|nr:DUF3137 domain-containing protein [Pelagibius marinus]